MRYTIRETYPPSLHSIWTRNNSCMYHPVAAARLPAEENSLTISFFMVRNWISTRNSIICACIIRFLPLDYHQEEHSSRNSMQSAEQASANLAAVKTFLSRCPRVLCVHIRAFVCLRICVFAFLRACLCVCLSVYLRCVYLCIRVSVYFCLCVFVRLWESVSDCMFGWVSSSYLFS